MEYTSVLRRLIRENRPAEVGPAAFVVYLAIKDYIWRGKPNGHRGLKEAQDEGYLVSRISIQNLRERTGGSKNTVLRAIQKLVEVGWIQVRSPGKRASNLYLLGTREGDKETFWSLPTGSILEPLSGSDLEPPTNASGSDLEPQLVQKWNPSGSDLEPQLVQFWDPKEGIRENTKEGTKKEAQVRASKPIRKTKKPTLNEGDRKEKKINGANGSRSWSAEPDPPPPRRKLVKDPDTGRMLNRDELRRLNSARAKRDRSRSYSSAEAVAAWRLLYWRQFGVEDPHLETLDKQRKVADLYARRVRDWFDGDAGEAMSFLRGCLRYCAEKEMSPPRLERQLRLTEERTKPWLFNEWKRNRLKVTKRSKR